MKIDDSNPEVCVIELEDPNALDAFRAGQVDHRRWCLYPETNELNKFIQDNRKHAQISVKIGDFYARVK